MSTAKWWEEPFAALDTEATGTDPMTARIVTAALVHRVPGERPKPIRWLIDPGVEVPAEAAAVHGYTNEKISELLSRHGGRPGGALRFLNGVARAIPADVAIFEIVGQAAATLGREHALVVHNAPYDCTLLEVEAARYGVDPITTRLSNFVGVVDPMVIERQFDPYRKSCYRAAGCDVEARTHECGGCRGGKIDCRRQDGVGCGSTDRTLTSLCAHYGVVLTDAHDAAADAIACVRLLFKLLEAWPQLAAWRLPTLHGYQETWRREQQDSLRKFFDKVGKEHDGMCPEWPIHSACTQSREAVA